MQWMKRVGLFVLLNLVIMISISVLTRVLGLDHYLTAKGLNLGSLAIFCLLWGMGGAFISLALSRVMAKWMMSVKVIPENTHDQRLIELKMTVHNLAKQAGLTTMPEVGIYESPEMNAFATGPTKSRSLVAVSTGLLYSMNQREVRGVLAHEVAHIANGDMVTMTLLQGVVNAFVMFLARIIAYGASQFFRSDEDEAPSMGIFFVVQIVLEIMFMILGSILIARFSRWREYRADAGAARLGGRENMIAALEALKRNVQLPEAPTSPAMKTMQIEGGRGSGLMRLFSSHPTLEDRIARLRNYQAAS
jgi:heat shock protein HtpX